MTRNITIGTRGSKLAIIQAETILAKLRETAPGLRLSLLKIATKGDRESNTALDRFSEEGVFVKELEKALIEGEIDLAVHSLKDLPTEIPDDLSLAAVTARLDPADALVSRTGGLAELTPGSKIGTGSPRRAVQLLACRPDLKIVEMRGNIDTRLQKVFSGTVDSIIVAAAAMIRLGWENRITEYLSIEHFTPAVGQGALGIEIRSGDKETAMLVSRINHKSTWQSTTAERSFLEALGGGCRAPIAALGTVFGNTLKLEGMIAGAKSDHILRCLEEDNVKNPEQIGIRLAQKMTSMGALDYIAEAKAH